MRLVLVIAVLASSAVCAQAAEDRYGPSRVGPAAGSLAAQPYAGPTLSWPGKAAPTLPPTAVVGPAARPELLADGLYRPATAPQAATPRPRPAAYGPPAPAPQTLYDRPAPQAAVLPPPPSSPPAPGGLYGGTGPRFYSLHRPYGETPDPIPAPPPGDGMAWRPEASIAGPVALSGVGDGVRLNDEDDGGMAGVGAADEAEEAERAAKRDAERAAVRRAAAAGGGQ